MYVYFLSPRPRERRNARLAMPDYSYLVHQTQETVTVSITYQIIKRLFTEGASLTINLRAAPNSTAVNLPVSRASSWSTWKKEAQLLTRR